MQVLPCMIPKPSLLALSGNISLYRCCPPELCKAADTDKQYFQYLCSAMSAAISSVHLCVHDKHRTVQWPNLTPYPDHETSNANVKASYLCFQARMLTSHNWLHIPDYKVHNETKNKSLTFSLAGSSSPLFSNPGGRLPSFAPLLGFVFSGEAALVLQLPQALVQAHLNAAVALDGRQLCPRGLLTLGCSAKH